MDEIDNEQAILSQLIAHCDLNAEARAAISDHAAALIRQVRADGSPSLMELFLSEYGLSSKEGVALMCLAEALLRVPDTQTIDALIEDKIAPGAWGQHLGQSASSLVNASTWALFLTGKLLDDHPEPNISHILRGAMKRLGEPVIRAATIRAMEEMGHQFVLGETIENALDRAKSLENRGYTYSYDMLGEAAVTKDDACRYHLAYEEAIREIAKHATHDDIRANPGISIKLSALHPRYETLQKERVMAELVPMVHALVLRAKSSNIGLNIDAEEAGRLDLSLDVIEAVWSDPVFDGWDGFGVVVQAYNKRAIEIIEHLDKLAERLDRKIMIRLVKGAYWDSEIKHAQVEGHDHYPVFTKKAATDVNYICCAEKLLSCTERIYPQFATHNAHTMAAILHMASDTKAFEFQRLHGMGDALHDHVKKAQGTRCRIYAPVGQHEDLLAYLVRRLLENGANSSFVNQMSDLDMSPDEIAKDPFVCAQEVSKPQIVLPHDIFAPERQNSPGFDLSNPNVLLKIEAGIAAFDQTQWHFTNFAGDQIKVFNPANGAPVGTYQSATPEQVQLAIERITQFDDLDARARADILNKAADLYIAHQFELFALLMREAGKTLADCVSELREAVDFLRYYAQEARKRSSLTGQTDPAGIFTCISPWNFPLAIFTGQIAAALATGNGVLAKPAESTSLIAHFAVNLLHKAGISEDALILVPGTGATVGQALTSHPKINGVCFTGSTQTAQLINRSMAEHLHPSAVLIAETGGLNAMIVDSTALMQQAVNDIVASAFQSAGQRCSALRVLYVQEDIAQALLEMLKGAVNERHIGDPRNFSVDIGPIISAQAAKNIRAYIDNAEQKGMLVHQVTSPKSANFVPPTILKINGIADLDQEVFGPVLHIATFKNTQLDAVIEAINGTGYGLTFGLHSRIDAHVARVIDQINAGNLYINRNQIGAVVGSQPFGGEGLSGTGPKAGGPKYLDRFLKVQSQAMRPINGSALSIDEIERAFKALTQALPQNHDRLDLPGPTGESNQYVQKPKGRILCLGPTAKAAHEQTTLARAAGCQALAIAPQVQDGLDGQVTGQQLTEINALDGVIYWGDDAAKYRHALCKRPGAIVPLFTQKDFVNWLYHERSISIDTTASGGNIDLLSN